MIRCPDPSSLRPLLFAAAPLICGLIALHSGMDASWDLRNYHFYNGWALLTGHLKPRSAGGANSQLL